MPIRLTTIGFLVQRHYLLPYVGHSIKSAKF